MDIIRGLSCHQEQQYVVRGMGQNRNRYRRVHQLIGLTPLLRPPTASTMICAEKDILRKYGYDD